MTSRRELTPEERRANALRKEAARIHERARKEFTESHKRCTVCRKWKLHSDFYKEKRGLGGIKSVCKPCFDIKSMRYRSELAPGRLDAIEAVSRANARARQQKASAERLKDAEYIIKELYPHYQSLRRLSTATGVSRQCICEIMGRKLTYIWPATHAKLRDFYVDFMEFRLQ